MRVVLLDQRGTGRSTPMTRQKITREEANELDETLKYYRADSIVEDAEFVRKEMLGKDAKYDVVLGQSFGGFCLTTYLSRYGDQRGNGVVDGRRSAAKKDPEDSYAKLLERVKRKRKNITQVPEDMRFLKNSRNCAPRTGETKTGTSSAREVYKL